MQALCDRHMLLWTKAGGLSTIYYSLTTKELMMMGLAIGHDCEVRSAMHSPQYLPQPLHIRGSQWKHGFPLTG